MAKITVELEVPDALFVLAALDVQRKSARSEESRLAYTGQTALPEYEIARATLKACATAYETISDALYGPALERRRWVTA